MKRFDGFMRKIKEFVRYPSLLNLSSYVPNNTFELFGVLIHEGFSLNSGHYFSYIKGFDDKWYLMNDSMVSAVNESTALSQKPYILFYRKKLIVPEIEKIEKIEIIPEAIKVVEKAVIKSEEKTEIKSEPKIILKETIENTPSVNEVKVEDCSLPLDESKGIDIISYSLNKDSIIYKNSERRGYLRHMNLINKKQLLTDKNLKSYSSKLTFKKEEKRPTKLNAAYNSLFDKTNIHQWEDNDNHNMKNQQKFLQNNNLLKKSNLNYKDKYDIEYDKGKLKKVKKKKDNSIQKLRDNPFQIVQKSLLKKNKY